MIFKHCASSCLARNLLTVLKQDTHNKRTLANELCLLEGIVLKTLTLDYEFHDHHPIFSIVRLIKWLLTMFCAVFPCFFPRSTTVPMILNVPWVSELCWGKNADRITHDSYRKRSGMEVNPSTKVHIQDADFSFTMGAVSQFFAYCHKCY